jgi:hypothetical protein
VVVPIKCVLHPTNKNIFEILNIAHEKLLEMVVNPYMGYGEHKYEK